MPPTSSSNGRLLCCIGLLVLASGCSQLRHELGPELSEAMTPTPALTPSLSAVMQRLGPPMRISASAEGYVMAWEHWRISEDAVGISLGALGADLLSLDWGDARMRGEYIVATFDREHQLTAAVYSSWDSEAGGGSALQPFIGLSLVDVDDLLESMPHHRWGGASLERLPRALNTPSRPDMGQGGIQQRGTPRGVGQQTLEMD